MSRNLHLNGYKIMWMLVLFDLPVTAKEERKAAAAFRHFLLDNGFAMLQYSAYTKVLSGKELCERYCKLIECNLPKGGKVDVLTITDKQYSNILSFSAGKKAQKSLPEQYMLF